MECTLDSLVLLVVAQPKSWFIILLFMITSVQISGMQFLIEYHHRILNRVYKKKVIKLWSARASSLYNLQKSFFHSWKDQAFSFRMSPFL